MKTKPIFTLLILLCLTVLSSCENGINDEDGTEEVSGTTHKKVKKTIRLSCDEETVSMTETPMTKAAGKTRTDETAGRRYYGINVYEETDTGLVRYAYGLFDSREAMTLTLVEGSRYKIECLGIRTGVDTLYHEDAKFFLPFVLGDNKSAKLANKFTYSKKNNIASLASGRYRITQNYTSWHPEMYTYYAELSGVDPSSVDEGVLQFTLKRAVFGLHFIVEPPGSGSATLTYLNSVRRISVKAGGETYDHEGVYSFHTVTEAWRDGYSGSTTLRVNWTYSDGTQRRDSVVVPISRNTMTTVRVSFPGPRDSSVGITEEDGEMSADTISWTFGE